MKKEGSQLKAGIILNYINIILGNLIPIFYTPIMLRLLGQSEYGLYKLATNVTSYLTLISFGIGTAVTRYLIKANTEKGKEEEEKYFALFINVFRVIALITLIVGIGLVLLLPVFYKKSLSSEELGTMRILVSILVANTMLSFLQTPYTSVVTSHERFVFLQITNIISTCVAPLLNLVALALGYKSIGMTIVTLAVNVFVRTMFYVYVRKVMGYKPRYKGVPKHVLKEILVFSFWIFLANVVTQLYNATDTVMIGMIPALATVGVAVYNVGAVFNNMVFSLATGVSTMLAPKANKMVFNGSTKDELTDLCIKTGRIQCYIVSLIITGFVSFGQPFIYYYAGSDYGDAYWVAIFMMIPNMIPLVQSVCLSITIAKNKHKFRSLVYLGIAIVNVIGTWFAMHKWGIIGAAVVTGVALVIGQGFVMNWYYHKKIGINIFKFWKKILPIYIAPIILCVITLLISTFVDFYNIPLLLIGIVVFFMAFCLINWFVVMNSYEKSIITSAINKIVIKIKR